MLALLLLQGCWPLLPGEYADYFDADDTGDGTGPGDTNPAEDADARVIGLVQWNEFVGGYWDSADPSGYAAAAWLEDGTDDHTAWDLGFSNGDCVRDPDVGWFASGTGEPDDTHLDLAGDPDIRLDASGSGLFESDFSEEPSGTYDLEAFEADGESWGADGALEIPRSLDYEDDFYTGDSPATVQLDNLARFRWGPRDTEGLYGVVSLRVIEGTDATSEVICGAPASAGGVDVDVEMLQRVSRADYILVMMGSAMETVVTLDGRDEASRFLGMKREIGAVNVN